jgi:anti-anti-sigma factor
MACTEFPVSHISDFNPTYQLGTDGAPALHSSVFSCSISRGRGRVAMGIIGEIDRTSAGQFRNQLLGAAKEHPAAIELDMKYVALADEAGVAVLIEAWRFALEHGIELAVKSPPPAIKRTFEIAPSGRLLSLQL